MKRLLVGLGNPGGAYAHTWHNAGFMVIDHALRELDGGTFKEKKTLRAEVCVAGDIILAKPISFMNNSGQAVRALLDFYKLKPEDVLVIHDEIDLPFGKTRRQKGGSSAGHRGIQSVIDHIGPEFFRLRIGVGNLKPPGMKTTDFVLGRIPQELEMPLHAVVNESARNALEFSRLDEPGVWLKGRDTVVIE